MSHIVCLFSVRLLPGNDHILSKLKHSRRYVEVCQHIFLRLYRIFANKELCFLLLCVMSNLKVLLYYKTSHINAKITCF